MGHGACDNLSRSVALERPTASEADLAVIGLKLLQGLAIPHEALRGVGLQAHTHKHARTSTHKHACTTRTHARHACVARTPSRDILSALTLGLATAVYSTQRQYTATQSTVTHSTVMNDSFRERKSGSRYNFEHRFSDTQLDDCTEASRDRHNPALEAEPNAGLSTV